MCGFHLQRTAVTARVACVSGEGRRHVCSLSPGLLQTAISPTFSTPRGAQPRQCGHSRTPVHSERRNSKSAPRQALRTSPEP